MPEVPLKLVLTRAGDVLETRRVRLVSPTFNAIHHVVQQWVAVKYDLLYNDEDGESITVGSQEEWEECLRVWFQIGTALLALKVHLSDEPAEGSVPSDTPCGTDPTAAEKMGAQEADNAEPLRADDRVESKAEEIVAEPAVVTPQAEPEQLRNETKVGPLADDAGAAQCGSDVAKGKKLKKKSSKVTKRKHTASSKAEILSQESDTKEEEPAPAALVAEQPVVEEKLDPSCKTCGSSLPGPLAIHCCSQCKRSGGVDHGPWCKHNPNRASVICQNRASTRSATVPTAAPSGNDPKTLYAAQIKRLQNMGFGISDKVIGLLVQNDGSLAAVVEKLLA